MASKLCICTALARLVPLQRLPSCCIASRSRCTAIIQVHALRWRADSFQRLPTRCIASNLCICTALARTGFFPAALWQMHCKKVEMHCKHLSTCSATASGFFPAASYQMYASNVCTCTALARLVSFQRLLADALQADRDARQSFKHMLCAGKLILSSGFLPDVSQAVHVHTRRWQD